MTEIISSVLTSAVVSGLATFFIQEWFKSKLQTKHELEIANFKHKLELAASERQIRYSRVFDDTAKTIATTYAQLLEFREVVLELTHTTLPMEDPNVQKLLTDAQQKKEAFLKCFPPNKLYVPKSTAKRIMDFHMLLYSSTVAFTLAKSMHDAERLKDLHALHEETKILLGLLEDDFQRLLGFTIEEKKTPAQ